MRNEGARAKLMKQVVGMTEEKVKIMVAWMRSRGIRSIGRARRRQTPLQEFKGNLASMTDEGVKEMAAGTQQSHPGYLASLIHLPALALRAIAKMVGWQRTEKGSR
jgi:hypothetical protein